MGITTCCCLDKGKTGLAVNFDKNVFFGNEIAKAGVTVDNHDCKLKISEIQFNVVQRMTIRARHQWNGKMAVISNRDRSGVA